MTCSLLFASAGNRAFGTAKIGVIVGTRPEAIKLAPVIRAFNKARALEPLVCDTGQHPDLCGQTLGYFGLQADCSLKDTMRPGQSLSSLLGRLTPALDEWIGQNGLSGVITQGDTMSAYCGALAAYFNKIPVFHVEAGLRSYNLAEPYPEEALRQMIARIAALHFAPTKAARDNLLRERIPAERIEITGNTGIDALFGLSSEASKAAEQSLAKRLDFSRPLTLATIHRRENHGRRLDNILMAIKKLALKRPEMQFLLPAHPNPAVGGKVRKELSNLANALVTEPLPYPELVCALSKAVLALSDSGGIQEEAPSLGAPLLILREETERPEGVELGFARLVGADTQKIVEEAEKVYARPRRNDLKANPYGDGRASERILCAIEKYTGLEK